MRLLHLGLMAIAPLAGCGGPGSGNDIPPGTPVEIATALRTPLAGKTLTDGDTTITLRRDISMDGTMDGTPVSGSWISTGREVCVTIQRPRSLSGTACQRYRVQGNDVTFTRLDGSRVTYRMSDAS